MHESVHAHGRGVHVSGAGELTDHRHAQFVGALHNGRHLRGVDTVHHEQDIRSVLVFFFDGGQKFGQGRGLVAHFTQQADVGRRVGIQVERATACTFHPHDGGDAHGEVGVGLRLMVQGGKAIDQAGNGESTLGIQNFDPIGDVDFGRGADGGDFTVPNKNDGIFDVVGRGAPVGHVDDRDVADGEVVGGPGSDRAGQICDDDEENAGLSHEFPVSA